MLLNSHFCWWDFIVFGKPKMKKAKLSGKTKTFSLTSTRAHCHGAYWTSSQSPMMLRIVLSQNWRWSVDSKPFKSWLRCLQIWHLVINYKRSTWEILTMVPLVAWFMRSGCFKQMHGQRRRMMRPWCHVKRSLGDKKNLQKAFGSLW